MIESLPHRGPGYVWEPLNLAEAERGLIEVWATGTRTTIAGPAEASEGTITISLRGLNRIISLDRPNHVISVEAGTTIGAIRAAAAAEGLWCPALRWLPPAVMIGAAVASGHGHRSRRYGAVSDYLLGSRFAAPGAGVVSHGGIAIKNATGFNLTAAVAGTRGRLAVLLSLHLRLVPLPRQRFVQRYTSASGRIWSEAAILAGVASAAPKGSRFAADAVEVGLGLADGRGEILVEADCMAVEGLEKLQRHFDGLAVGLDLAPDRDHDRATWASAPTVQRGTVAPGEFSRAVTALTTEVRRLSPSAQIHAEATGGAVDLDSAVPIQCPLISNPPSAGVQHLRARLKRAFDPNGLLPDFSNAPLP